MNIFGKLFGKSKDNKKSNEILGKPLTIDEALQLGVKLPEINIQGVNVKIAMTINSIVKVALEDRRCVFKVDMDDYTAIILEVDKKFKEVNAPPSFIGALINGVLICDNCHKELPSSIKMGLAMDSQKVSCPNCNARRILFYFNNPKSESITENDILSIRKYWRDLFLTWWNDINSTKAIDCRNCYKRLIEEDGFMQSNGMAWCQTCVDETLSTALDTLRKSPNYYGNGEIEKARFHATKK